MAIEDLRQALETRVFQSNVQARFVPTPEVTMKPFGAGPPAGAIESAADKPQVQEE